MNSNPKKLIAVAKMALNRCDHPFLPQNDKERIQFAIRSLQLALKNQPEIHYELAKIYHLYTNNYENAEFHAIRAGNSEKAISLLVEILKSNNKPKAAIKVVQNALSDNENVSNFMNHLSLLENDYKSYLKMSRIYINKSIESNDHLTTKQSLLNYNFELNLFNEFNEIHQNLPNERIIKQQMLILEIIYNIYKGESTVILLSALHGSLLVPNYQEQTFRDFNEITWPYLVAYLISGISHKSKDPARSTLFFNEGLKAINHLQIKATIHQTSLIQANVFKIKTCFIVHLIENSISIGDLNNAFQMQLKLTNRQIKLMEKRILFNWAILLQSIGIFDSSLVLYNHLLNSEFKEISKLNIQLMYKEKDIFTEKDAKNTKQLILFYMINSFKSFIDGEFKSTKEFLLKGIKLSNSIQDALISSCLLALLGTLFKDTNPEKSIKMFHSCLKLSNAAKCIRLTSFVASELNQKTPEIENLEQKYFMEIECVKNRFNEMF